MNNSKIRKIVYWIATLWLSLGMLSTGLAQILQEDNTVTLMTEMGFPIYFLTMLGIGKILGVIVILVPKLPLMKEWAYAGFMFIIGGAAYTYVALGNYGDLYHLGLLLILTVSSWYLRPASRKVV